MAVEYYIQWLDASGARRAILAGAGGGSGEAGHNYFLRLAYRKTLNAPGSFRIDLPAELDELASFSDKDQVEIYRRDIAAGIPWTCDFYGIFRDEALVDDANGRETFIARGPGALERLAWYHVLWPADVTNRTTFANTRAETVAKTLVAYNADATSAIVANGRDRNAPNYGISVASDTASGNLISVSCGGRGNLLSTLQSIQPISGGDFDLIKIGANSWEFRFYPGQRGTDRRSTLLFSKALGNMTNVKYELVRSKEKTAAIVGGQGRGNERTITSVTGANFATNPVETFINASDVRDSAALAGRGSARLAELQAKRVFSFDVLQTEGCRYGRDFFVGDLARAFHPRVGTIDVQVTAVDVEFARDGEQLSVEVALL